ncbi:hypothetical protein THF5G08_30326 [Vibrio jasicida]|nr:hypothetical protein THF5G08_30326 [Vibrio jasicida]
MGIFYASNKTCTNDLIGIDKTKRGLLMEVNEKKPDMTPGFELVPDFYINF